MGAGHGRLERGGAVQGDERPARLELPGARGDYHEPDQLADDEAGTDSAGQFFGGGPFLGPYGGPQGPVGQSGQVTGALDSIWGKPVVVTTAIGAGTALVGAFSAASQLFARGGRTVEASTAMTTSKRTW